MKNRIKPTIYGYNLLRRELKVSFLETKNNKLYTAILVLLSSLVIFFAHNLIISFNGDFIKKAFGSYINRDTFALLSLYNIMSYVILFFFMFYNYDAIAFTRANKNRWYVLRKMNMNVWKIFAAKYFSIAYKMFAMYLGGFIVTFLLGVLFNYSIIWGSVISVFFVGVTPIVYISILAVFLSMFFSTKSDVKICCAITTVLMVLIQRVTKYNDIVENVHQMDGLYKVVLEPVFWGYVLACVTLYIVGVIIGKRSSEEYSLRDKKDFAIYWDNEKNVIARKTFDYKKVISIIIASISIIILIGVVVKFIVTAGCGVVGAMAKKGDDDLLGRTPYVETTDEMSGYLEKDEYAAFKKVSGSINVGDVILYRDKDNDLKVRLVIESFGDGGVIVDIANYTDDQELGSKSELIYPSDICGVMTYRSVKVGKMIVSSETASGKFIMLVIPLFVITFYEYFDELGTRIKKRRDELKENN